MLQLLGKYGCSPRPRSIRSIKNGTFLDTFSVLQKRYQISKCCVANLFSLLEIFLVIGIPKLKFLLHVLKTRYKTNMTKLVQVLKSFFDILQHWTLLFAHPTNLNTLKSVLQYMTSLSQVDQPWLRQMKNWYGPAQNSILEQHEK